MAIASSDDPPSDLELFRSLLRLSREISQFDSTYPPSRYAGGGDAQLRRFSSVARKSKLLSVLFEDLALSFKDKEDASSGIPRSASLCLREILLVLQRFKALLSDCAARSRSALLLLADAVANEFHELTVELSTLLDILQLSELHVADDVRELVGLLKAQCRRSSPAVDPAEDALRREILSIISQVEREIVPDRGKLEDIFWKMGLDDARSCREEIESLEREIGDRIGEEKWKPAMFALVGLLRYAKCVVFGASTPRSESSSSFSRARFSFSCSSSSLSDAVAELPLPADFRCPISLELMRDPVVVATGQTYDRDSITRWIGSGHATCPKSGQALAHLELVPNRALRNHISNWCRENNAPFDAPAEPRRKAESSGAVAVAANKAALEAARMTASFLVEKLEAAPSTDAANRVVHELRQLAKSGSEYRAFVAEAGAIPLLLPLLCSEDTDLQTNAVTALLNLSIMEANKKRIMHTVTGVDDIVNVLASGHTWRAKENAAATILSLTAVLAYRRVLGRHPLLVEGLVELVRKGPGSSKKDGMSAMLSLAGDRENIGRLVEAGVVEAALNEASVDGGEVSEEAVAVVAAVARRGGAEAVWGARGSVPRLVGLLRRGSDWARENAASALVALCRRLGGKAVAQLAAVPGIELAIWELTGAGTERARKKAEALGRIYRRWAEAVEKERTARLSAVALAGVDAATPTTLALS